MQSLNGDNKGMKSLDIQKLIILNFLTTYLQILKMQ